MALPCGVIFLARLDFGISHRYPPLFGSSTFVFFPARYLRHRESMCGSDSNQLLLGSEVSPTSDLTSRFKEVHLPTYSDEWMTIPPALFAPFRAEEVTDLFRGAPRPGLSISSVPHRSPDALEPVDMTNSRTYPPFSASSRGDVGEVLADLSPLLPSKPKVFRSLPNSPPSICHLSRGRHDVFTLYAHLCSRTARGCALVIVDHSTTAHEPLKVSLVPSAKPSMDDPCR